MIFLGGGCWLIWRNSRLLPPAVNEPAPRRGAVPPPGPPPKPADLIKLPEFGSAEFSQAIREKAAAWLAGRNRDATSLLVMWDLTDDDSFLREAAEKYPQNPQICQAMLNSLLLHKGTPEQRKLWIDRLIAADPENPVGYHHLAKLQADQGDLAGVLETMTTALSKSKRLDTSQREHLLALKEGLVATGTPLSEACQLEALAPIKHTNLSPFNGMNAFFKTRFEQLKSEGKSEDLQQLAGLALGMAEQTRLSPSPSWMTEMQTSAQKLFYLRQLDPSTEIVNTGRTAAEEYTEVETQRNALLEENRKINPAMSFFRTAPLEIQSGYADRLVMDGQITAFRYLIEEMEKAKP